MKKTCWGLTPPIYVMAPMANITNLPFASQASRFGADLVWTPMVHTDTILNNWLEAEKILDFKNMDNYVIQLVGSEPKKFRQAISVIETSGLKPLGFDLNAGCPDKNIVKSGCGGALLKDTPLIIAILKEMLESTKKPVSLKTRVGFYEEGETLKFLGRASKLGLSAITIHPRTVRQGYAGVADWSILPKVKEQIGDIALLGSGDVTTWEDALEKPGKYSVDGVMIGRGALGRPWIFKEIKEKKIYSPTLKKKKELALELAEKSFNIWGEKGLVECRKHYGWYFRGFNGAKELRESLMQTKGIEEVRKILSA